MATRIISLAVQDYRSFQSADLTFGSPHFLVGPNGGGKSNLLDAIHFVCDAFEGGLGFALERRGGVDLLIRKVPPGSQAPPAVCSLQVTLEGAGWHGRYALQLGRGDQSFEVVHEVCDFERAGGESASFRAESGSVTSLSVDLSPPQVGSQSLLLPLLAGVAGFKEIYDGFRSLRFLAVVPHNALFRQAVVIRGKLGEDGANLPMTVAEMIGLDSEAAATVTEYMRALSPPLKELFAIDVEGGESFRYREFADDTKGMPPQALSEGQVRALAILVTLFFSPPPLKRHPITLIEEPEMGLHPAAVAVLLDALLEASETRQVIISTHSADLLDDRRVQPEMLSHIRRVGGVSRAEPVTDSSKRIIREELCSVGELLRQGQLAEPGTFVGEQPPAPSFPFPLSPNNER